MREMQREAAVTSASRAEAGAHLPRRAAESKAEAEAEEEDEDEDVSAFTSASKKADDSAETAAAARGERRIKKCLVLCTPPWVASMSIALPSREKNERLAKAKASAKPQAPPPPPQGKHVAEASESVA